MRVASSAPDRATVRALVDELLLWFETTWGMDPAHYVAELDAFDELYGGATGRAFLAECDGRPAGCAVFRDSGDGAAELRRMYVRPGRRRKGVARALIAAAEAEARALGYRRLRLMTSPRFEGAIDLYLSAGYSREPYYREAWADDAVALGRDL